MIRLKIPTILRNATEAASVLEVEGATVGEALATAIERHPGLRGRLFDDDGSLRRFLNVFVEEEDIRFEEGLDTPVAPGQTISLVPAVAGGCDSGGPEGNSTGFVPE